MQYRDIVVSIDLAASLSKNIDLYFSARNGA